ncbi:MAG: VIT1/CCC1 transporter family protein [Candidatus Altiarchaeota archaeon]
MVDEDVLRGILTAQRNELTEYIIYDRLSRVVRDGHNSGVLKRISGDERRHHDFWRKHTGRDVKPDMLKVWWYYMISRVFGITFGIKLMEKGEERAQVAYNRIAESIPEARKILEDEDSHEKELIGMIDEERLKYVGSMVLGLSDALVELTGALAGFTLALQNTRLIAVTGLIVGVAASLSMAASEYLSTKSEGGGKNPVKASVYTGSAYVLTVMLLVAPYLIFNDIYVSLCVTLFNVVMIITIFTFYISVAKDLSFRARFVEMVVISLGVAAFSFALGYVVRITLGVDI